MNYAPTVSLLDYKNEKQIFHTLNAIKAMVKSKILRNDGIKSLKLINPEKLEPKNQVFYYFINSQYYFFQYKTHGRFCDLREAKTYIDKMIASAREGKVNIKSNSLRIQDQVESEMEAFAKKHESALQSRRTKLPPIYSTEEFDVHLDEITTSKNISS